MKKIIKSIVIFFVLSTPLFAQNNNEKQCAKIVKSTILAIQSMSEKTGTEQKLKGLSIQDIRKMQKEKGSCETVKEINKLTMK